MGRLLRLSLEEDAPDADATLHINAPGSRMGSSGHGSARGWQPPSVAELQAALPQYEISEFLARGGMGAVYRGTQRALKHAVAIKVLPPEEVGDDAELRFAERFKHEAQAMARLSHPNIVAVHDAGEVELGRALAPASAAGGDSRRLEDQPRYPSSPTLLYFVMEFIEGADVGQLIASEGRLDPARAARITTAVCEALAFAHEEGIIHRDIKPSNVMIDRKGRVKVADFGLAKVVNVESTLLTGSNIALGTPDFIAPEALGNGAALVDHRADLYAVGVMLYQMLTGTIPRGRFALPSGVVPQVDPGFDAIVDKAMQADRDKRYSSAIELKTDVERVTKENAHEGSADSLRGSAALVRSSQSSGAVAKTNEAGRSARAPLLLGTAAALVIGVAAWLLMDEPVEAEGRAAAPKAPTQNSAAGVAATSAPSNFPTGQWVRPFRQASDLHANWINGGATFVDGWITPGAGTNHSITLSAPNGRGKNWGVRARYRWSAKGRAFLVLRRGGSAVEKNVATYELRVEKGTVFFRRVQGGGSGGGAEFFPLGEATAMIPKPDTELLLEAFVIGRTLYGRVNGVVLTVESDGVLAEGGFEAASELMPYRDLEFINLDGLSEAEALKVVGVE